MVINPKQTTCRPNWDDNEANFDTFHTTMNAMTASIYTPSVKWSTSAPSLTEDASKHHHDLGNLANFVSTRKMSRQIFRFWKIQSIHLCIHAFGWLALLPPRTLQPQKVEQRRKQNAFACKQP